MSKIVISYRHSDSPAAAGRVCDKLRAHFGAASVFMDVTSNKPGRDFRRQIGKALRNCDVMIAVIGRKWLGDSRRGQPRILDEHDFIRIEVETAMECDIPIIPMLVDGASMPAPDDLPETIKQFCYVHALDVDSGRHFHRDTDILINAINELLEDSSRAVPKSGLLSRLSGVGLAPVIRGTFALIGAALVVAGISFLAPFRLFVTEEPRPAAPARSGITVSAEVSAAVGGPTRQVTVKPLALNGVRELRSLAFSPDQSLLAVAGDDGIIRLWNAETFKLQREIQARAAIGSTRPPGAQKIVFSSTGDVIYSVGLNNKVEIFDPLSRRHIGTLEPEANSKVSVFYGLAAFPRDEQDYRWIAAGGDDGCFRIWHAKNPETPLVSKFVSGSGRVNEKCVQPVNVEKGKEVQAIAYAPEGRGVYAVGSRDGSMFLFSEQREARSIRAHDGPIWQLAFSPNGERIASAGADGKIRVWNFADHRLLRTFDKHTNSVSSLAWSPDGQSLVSGSEDRSVRLWDVPGNRQVGEPFAGHRKDVLAVAFHPNGKWIVSASQDGMLKVWDASGKSREAFLTLIAYEDGRHIVFHQTGIYTGTPDIDQRITVTYPEDGMERVLPDDQKNRLYLKPDEFAKKIQSLM